MPDPLAPAMQPVSWRYSVQPNGQSLATFLGDVEIDGQSTVGPSRPPGYDSVAAFQAVAFPITDASVATRGYAVAGDGGGAIWIPAPVPGPAPGKLQTAYGQWFQLALQPLFAEMFGAVGDGDGAGHGTDNAAAFAAFYAYALTLPAADGRTLNLYAGRCYASTDNMPFVGLDNFTLEAHGAAFQNINAASAFGIDRTAFVYGGWGYVDAVSANMTAPKGLGVLNNVAYRINTAAAGAASVTTTTAGDAGNFTPGQWALTCSQIHFVGGSPPAMRYQDYNPIASANAGTGVVAFANGTILKHGHNAALPALPLSGNFGSAAQVFPMLANWNVRQTYRDLNVLPPRSPVGNGVAYRVGRDVSVIGGSAPGITTSQSMGGVVERVTMILAAGWEPYDKLNATAYHRDCLIEGASIGGDGAGGSTVFENCNIKARVFSAVNMRIVGGQITGQITTDICENLLIENTFGNFQGVAGIFATANLTVDGTNVTFAAAGGAAGQGRITIPLAWIANDFNTRQWFNRVFEGAQVNFLTTGTLLYTGQFATIAAITGDATNVYVDVFATAAIPNGQLLATPGLMSYAGRGNGGSIPNGDLDTLLNNRFATTLAPVSGQAMTLAPLLQGYPVSLTVSVVKPATVAGGAYLVCNTPGGFVASVMLKNAGVRQMTPGANTGAQAGDVLANLGAVYAGKANLYLSATAGGAAGSFPDPTAAQPIVAVSWVFSDPSRQVQRS